MFKFRALWRVRDGKGLMNGIWNTSEKKVLAQSINL